MPRRTYGFRLRCLIVGLSLCALPCCVKQGRFHAASGTPRKPDPLLGKWVMIADNGAAGNGTIADFRSNGTVVFNQSGKQTVVRYRRVPGKTFFARRMPALQEPTKKQDEKDVRRALDR